MRMQMFERSAGIIMLREENGKVYILLLKKPSGYWECPKGKIRSTETTIEAALREVQEETGIRTVEVLDGFKHEIYYKYVRHPYEIKKSVTYYVGFTNEKEVRISDEHLDFGWFELDDIISNTDGIKTYSDVIRMLNRVREWLPENLKEVVHA